MIDTLLLVLGGAVLLAYSAYSTAKLRKTVNLQGNASSWKVLHILMICFFCGYLGVVVFILLGRLQDLISIVGLIFFCGAFFVLIVTRVGHRTISQLEEEVVKRTAELREAKEKTEQYSRQKSNFLAVMSHEIRTPLHSVIATADLLASSNLNRDQKLYTSILKQAGQNLLAQVNDVLDISKIEAGKLELEKRPFLPTEILKNVSKIIGVRAKQSNLYFHSNSNISEELYLMGDSAKLEQILINLASNALKFTLQGGITVFAEVKQQSRDNVSLFFSVTDTGVGFNEKSKKKIFESFTQSDAGTARRFGGTGLGLTICKDLLHLMGSQIEVESKPGKGSKFYFTVQLPIALPRAVEIEKTEPKPRPFSRPERPLLFSGEEENKGAVKREVRKKDLKGLHILLVEDNSDNRLLFKAFIKNTGIELDTAENGQEAVTLACSHDYDLIIMDIQMPIKDGFVATKEIRAFEKAQRTGRNTPIVALSASATREDMLKARSCGCNDYLSKPITRATLISAINRYRASENMVAKS